MRIDELRDSGDPAEFGVTEVGMLITSEYVVRAAAEQTKSAEWETRGDWRAVESAPQAARSEAFPPMNEPYSLTGPIELVDASTEEPVGTLDNLDMIVDFPG